MYRLRTSGESNLNAKNTNFISGICLQKKDNKKLNEKINSSSNNLLSRDN